MQFWCGVAVTLLFESVALIIGREWVRRKIREVRHESR